MIDHPLAKPPMRRSLAKPPPQPASTCAHCFRPGIVATDQSSHAHSRDNDNHQLAGIRFDCTCGATWTVDRRQALEHGAWLQRLNHATQRDV